jgi:Ca-activated chloride channel homolog
MKRKKINPVYKKKLNDGPSEEVGVSSYFKKNKGLEISTNKIFPVLLFLFIMGIVAWIVHLSIRELHKPFNLQAPKRLWFLLIIPVLGIFYMFKEKKRHPNFGYSRLALLSSIKPGLRTYFKSLPPIFRLAALGLFIFAFARPELSNTYEDSDEQGIDIVFALDISLSMRATDIDPDRLVAAKEVMSKFIKNRPKDRIGLVVFGQYAYPYCPLTLDHKAVQRLLRKVKLRTIDSGKATAIGEALGTSLNMIQKTKSKSKVVILLTDGANNAGEMGPKEAAQYASTLGVKIHTILMGNPNKNSGFSLFGRQAPVDPRLLEYISSKTGGISYLATDKRALEKRFQKLLDKMKKTKFVQKIPIHKGIQSRYIAGGIILLLIELLLSLTWLRRNP